MSPRTALRSLGRLPLRGILWGFRLVHRSSRWLEQRFTPAGRFAIGFASVAGAMGVDTRLNLAHQLFALLAALLLLAMLWSLGFRGRFRVRRDLPRYGAVGQPLQYRMHIHPESGKTERGLELLEQLECNPPTLDDFLRERDPWRRGRNWFDRMAGYPRWAWMMRRHAGAAAPDQALPDLPPARSTEIRLELTPLRRGYIRFTGVVVARADPLGLFRAWRRVQAADRVLILPQRHRVNATALPGGRRYQPGGVSMASEIGESDEFASLREYRPGDPVRHIHWRSLAKLGRPVVKEYSDEFFVRHALVLDTFARADADADADADFEAAVSVAASYAAAIDTQDSLLDLLLAGADVHHLTAGRGLSQSAQLLELLACATPCEHRRFSRLKNAVTDNLGAISGCICVLLDWDEPRQEMIRKLSLAQVPVLTLVVSGRLRGPLDPEPMGRHPERLHLLAPERLAEGLARL